MPKTLSGIWPLIPPFENLLKGWENVNKGRKRFAPPILRYWSNLEANLSLLHDQLVSFTWTPKPLRCFAVHDPKYRIIQAPQVSDRVLHHALMRHIIPAFERRFRPESFACRKNMGTHAASARTTAMVREATARWQHPYVLQGDISNFFFSIVHEILLTRLGRVISDRNVMRLFEALVCETPGYQDRGLPLGAMTSQWLANLYLDAFDHFVCDELAAPYYVRYMDDWVLIGPNKVWCRVMLDQLTAYLDILQLEVNPKTAIYPASHGIDFVGYRHWPTHTLPRKKTVKRARRGFRTMQDLYARGLIDLDYVRPRVGSFAGYLKHCDAHVTGEHIFENFVLCREGQKKEAQTADKA